MALNKANIPLSAQQIKNQVINDKINFNHWVQRGFVWKVDKKSALIESMIIGYPIPPVFAKRNEDKQMIILDGKQRLSTIASYLNDEFKLSTLNPVTFIDEEENKEVTMDITGKSFSELPLGLQNHLKTVSLSMIYFDNLTAEEEREVFKRLNQGMALSTKSRLLASCTDIESMLGIGSHKLFDEMLSDKAKENKNQVALIMKCWVMLFDEVGYATFESKDFNPLIENTKITDEEKEVMVKVFDMIADVHEILLGQKEKKVAKKLYTETHMVSLMPFFKEAIEEEVNVEVMADWIVSFYDTDNKTASVSEEYNDACSNGSAKNSNIVARHEALAGSFNKFIEENDNKDKEDFVDEATEEAIIEELSEIETE